MRASSAVALALLLAACDRPAASPRDADAPAPIELAPSAATLAPDPQLPLVTVDASGRAAPAASARAKAYALAVDHRATSGAARQALLEILSAGTAAVELRVGGAGAERAIRVCSHARAAELEGPDCWGRTVTRPPAADAAPAAGRPADSGASGDLVEGQPGPDLSAPLELSLSIEPDFMNVRMQGRLVRTLAMAGPTGGGASPNRSHLGQTLEVPRRHNTWDHRAAVRVADGVPWAQLVEILDVLVVNGFDQIALEGVAGDPRA